MISPDETNNLPVTSEDKIDTLVLNNESFELINKLIAEKDETKTKELIALFNTNQNKKTIIRNNKLNELLDLITDQAIKRFTLRPDEISNQELLQGLKTVQDSILKGQQGIMESDPVTEAPIIQINQQNNEINLSRESRDRVKSAVLGILQSITQQPNPVETTAEDITTKIASEETTSDSKHE